MTDIKQDELRDKITRLRRERDAHQMDEPDYVDNVMKLIHTEVTAVLSRLEPLVHEGRGTIAWEMDNMADAIAAEKEKYS